MTNPEQSNLSDERRCNPPAVERTNIGKVLEATYVLRRRSGDRLIARDAVEPANRRRLVADSFLAFRRREEAESFRREMPAEQFEVVALAPDAWLEVCRDSLRDGLTYVSLPGLEGGIVVKKAVRLADILALVQGFEEGLDHDVDAHRWN